MSWSTFSARISDIMVSGGFTPSETTFDIENLPSSVSHKSFCVLSPSFGQGSVRSHTFNPEAKISVIFNLGNSSVTLYDAAISLCEWIINNVKRSNMTGNNDIEFVGMASKMDNTENFMICEFTFNATYQL